MDENRPAAVIVTRYNPHTKTPYEKAEESCISLDEIFDMYNPSSKQNRATYFPNDEDIEMEKLIQEKRERKRQRDQKRAEKMARRV